MTGKQDGMRSYRDVTLVIGDRPPIKLSDAPPDYMLVCSRSGGWEVWQSFGTVRKMVASEFSEPKLKVIVDDFTVCGPVPNDEQMVKRVVDERLQYFIDWVAGKHVPGVHLDLSNLTYRAIEVLSKDIARTSHGPDDYYENLGRCIIARALEKAFNNEVPGNPS